MVRNVIPTSFGFTENIKVFMGNLKGGVENMTSKSDDICVHI
jgi:hypothetical protein